MAKKRISLPTRDKTVRSLLPLLLLFGSACGGGPLSTRIVETPTSNVVSYGAPHDVSYSAELDPALNEARITVYRRARCDVIPVQLVDRVEEKFRGDEVVERTHLGKGQNAQPARGEVDCAQTYAQNVDVMLQVGSARFPVGKTDSHGVVVVDLSQLMQTGAMGSAGEQAVVMVRPPQAQPTQSAGQISLAELNRQQTRVNELLEELRPILDSGTLTQEQSARAYELYQTLFSLAPSDPRVEAVAARFWELVYRRRQVEVTANMQRNLQALGEARETLKAMGDAALPFYVQAAVSSGTLDRRALEWSSLRLLAALRGRPALCAAGFSYAKLPSYGLNSDAILAAQYLQFAYNGAQSSYWASGCPGF